MLRWAQIAPFVLGSRNIGMASGTLEVYTLRRVVAIGMGTYNSLGEGNHSRQVWLQGHEPVGCVGQGCLDSCLKKKLGLCFGS